MEQFLVTFLCSQLTLWAGNQYNSACANFTNATFIQSGLHSQISSVQDDLTKVGTNIQNSIKQETGETPWKVAAVVYGGYSAVRGNLQISTNARPFADTINLNANTQTQNLTLIWHF